MTDEKIKLKAEDWDLLFPEKVHKLGTTKIPLRPLNLRQLAQFKKIMETITPDLEKRKITQLNYSNPDNIIFMVGLLVEHAPDFLADITNIDREDIIRIPLAPLSGLIVELIELNIESKQGLEKNLKALGAMIFNQAPGESETQLTNSLKQGISGKISKNTPKGK